jgi:predicted ribosomally synthesized peptide with nif11-like leader
MSVENLKKYGQLCAEKEEVRKKAKEIGIKDLGGQIAHAKSLGLEFSKEDVETLAKEAGVDRKDELSEEELKKVAGGFVSTTIALASLVLAGAGIAGIGAGAAVANQPKW